jgi:hypothetical protein
MYTQAAEMLAHWLLNNIGWWNACPIYHDIYIYKPVVYRSTKLVLANYYSNQYAAPFASMHHGHGHGHRSSIMQDVASGIAMATKFI